VIKFEVFRADGERLISNDWADSEARQLAAYRMRWLSRRPGRWARTTDSDGRVRTFGDVPEGQEAPAGHYVARRVNADFSDGEIVKHFTPKTTKSLAEEWRLSNRMGVNGELVIRWVEDKPEPKVHYFESTQDAYDGTQTRDDIADGDVLVGAHPVAITRNHGELHACERAVAESAGPAWLSSRLMIF